MEAAPKRTRLSYALLSNFVLIVPLLKNITSKFGADSSTFYQEFNITLTRVNRMEKLLKGITDAEN